VTTFSTAALGVANHSITAVYGGDADFSASTSSVVTQTVDQDATTSVAVSSANPSVFGQSVTFTATITANAPGAGTPSGMVTFMDGATTLGSGTLDGSGVATFSDAALGVGSHSITAVYVGDADFTTSTSPIVTQVVNQDATAAIVVSSANPSVFGQSVTFTATITANAPGAGTPSGTVTFMDGATTLGTGTLNSSGQTTFSSSSLSVGGHSITVVYVGESIGVRSVGDIHGDGDGQRAGIGIADGKGDFPRWADDDWDWNIERFGPGDAERFESVRWQSFDHDLLWRRYGLRWQYFFRGGASRESVGERDDAGFVGESGCIRPSGHVHGDRFGQRAKRGNADRNGDI